MSTATKTNARDALINKIKAAGWVLDTTATTTEYGYVYDEQGRRINTETQVQQPFTYAKDAAHGGRWRIALEFKTQGYSGTSNTLRYATVFHIDADPAIDPYTNKAKARLIGRIKPHTKWNGTQWLTQVLLDQGTLRQQTEAFAINPDLAVWVALESEAKDREVSEANWAARRADREARDQPIKGITVSQGYNSEWSLLKGTLKATSAAVTGADGKTDIQAAVDALKAAVAAIDAVVER